jgi:SH3-like domain-containing protein
MKTFTKRVFLSFAILFAFQCIVADDSAPITSDKAMLEYVVANATVCPVRENPSEAAEQATQLLFGEVCEVIERLSSWTKIRSTLDGQVGWVSSSMLTRTDSPVSVPRYPQTDSRVVVTAPMAAATPLSGGADLLLTLGTRLPNYSHGIFEVLGQQYSIDSTCVSQPISHSEASNSSHGERPIGGTPSDHHRVVAIAKSLLNTPYLWGGKNMMGLDCSGFTQVVYAAMGINILRNAREQITQGELVPSLADAQPGDLAFFDHADRDPKATKITHVGLLLSPTEIIHCAGGRVHIDAIDEQGILLSSGKRTHHLAAIKRYL